MKRHQHRRPPVPLKAVSPQSKGLPSRKIIGKVVHEGREYLLHATKGYRATRA